jgi:hypothetical protein
MVGVKPMGLKSHTNTYYSMSKNGSTPARDLVRKISKHIGHISRGVGHFSDITCGYVGTPPAPLFVKTSLWWHSASSPKTRKAEICSTSSAI